MPRGFIRQRSKIRKDFWTVRIYLGLDPSSGKRLYRSVTVKGTKARAERRMAEMFREVEAST